MKAKLCCHKSGLALCNSNRKNPANPVYYELNKYLFLLIPLFTDSRITVATSSNISTFEITKQQRTEIQIVNNIYKFANLFSAIGALERSKIKHFILKPEEIMKSLINERDLPDLKNTVSSLFIVLYLYEHTVHFTFLEILLFMLFFRLVYNL